MIRWTGLAPWELNSPFQVALHQSSEQDLEAAQTLLAATKAALSDATQAPLNPLSYLTESFYKIVLQKSNLVKTRQLLLYI